MFGNMVFTDTVKELKMTSSGFSVGPRSNGLFPYQRRDADIQTQGRQG